ncbi:MAG: hypothetical protein GXY52_07085 [Chloroflexi bacterium]|nr:hypothetical protein [Chloroflexota bacterium]
MSTLLAGFGRSNITPPEQVYMMGYGARNVPSVGIHDDLYASVLALSDGEAAPVIIVALDVCEFDVDCIKVVKGVIQGITGLAPERMLINTSHTHAGPMVCPGSYSRFEPRYYGEMAVRAGMAAKHALDDLQPAELSCVRVPLEIGANRRQVMADGSIQIGVNLAKPRDPHLNAWVMRRADAPDLVLWSAPFHGATVTSDNLWISSEWMGSGVRQFEAANPEVRALFVQGCCGNQNPYRERNSFEQLDEHGAAAAQALGQALVEAQTCESLPLRLLSDSIELPLDSGGTFSCPLRALRLGDAVLLSMGAEPFIEYALAMQAHYNPTRLLVLGYTDATIGYIPTAEAFDEGGYEPNSFGWFSQGQKLSPTCENVTKEALLRALLAVTS